MKYYSLKNILTRHARYNLIFGERSNGKTYAVLQYALERSSVGEQFAIVRRWRDDFVGKRGQQMFAALVENGEIERVTNGKWSNVYSYSGRWFFCNYDDKGKMTKAEEPFAYAFALTSSEHDKSTSYPKIKTVLFDECITRESYLPDEFIIFMNVLSTIIRERNDVTIFMLGNTVNKYCPYFSEMGLNKIREMNPGDIALYKYGESDLSVAVEYCGNQKRINKPSDVYFAFDNPKLNMITRGAWEIAVYPHKPCTFKPKDILFTYFVQFADDLLQCEIIKPDDGTVFTFVHRKTTELKDPDNDLIFSTEYSPRRNWRRNILKPSDNITQKIAMFYGQDKVYYQDNEIGEIMRNYLQWCKSSSIITK